MSQFPSPKIQTISAKKVIGESLAMSYTNFQVSDLWKKFLPKIHQITNRNSSDLLSISIYQAEHFSQFNPNREFEKWAGAEVHAFDNLPESLSQLIIPEGKYAIFHYKGLPTDNRVFQWIFSQWLPSSGYELDHRPHFEVLGEKYENGSPDSEEDIYIPIKEKSPIN